MNLGMIFSTLFKTLIQLLKSILFLFIPLLFVILFWICIVILFYFYFRFVKRIKPLKQEMKVQKMPSLFKRLFVLFPKQLTLDILQRNRNEFNEPGIYVVVGEQGSGKSITMVYLLRKWQARYPKVKVYTNDFGYDQEDGVIETWSDIIEYKNGKDGVINVLDEIQTWFPSSKTNSTVPPELFTEICQQRKQKKAVVGTTQVFGRLSKEFREQTSYIYFPKTILGCLTIVRVSKPKYYDMKSDRCYKYVKTFCFAHTKELRNAYDTYKIIEKYKNASFVPNSTILDGSSSEVPSVTETEGPDNA